MTISGSHWRNLLLMLPMLVPSLSQARLNPRLEDGLAITHPRIVRAISQNEAVSVNGIPQGVGLAYYLDPTGKSTPLLSNLYLSKLPLFQNVMGVVDRELKIFTQTTSKPGDTVGVGLNFHNRSFDMRFLSYDRAVFSLVGVINRLDKTYLDPRTCGETRLIYRLAYNVMINDDKDKTVISRLPMTINLILHAKSPDSKLTCQEIAQRWKNLNVEGKTVPEAYALIMGENGPLAPELRDRKLLKQLEINLQLSRKAAANRPDFGGHAVYLLKVLKWDAQTQNFVESKNENQVDPAKAKAFYQWLFENGAKQERIAALDRGTIVIPEQFLADRAYSIAPGGLSRIANHPLAGTISDDEIAAQLKDVPLAQMQNIRSVEGFKRRLSDVSCTGCHQTRGIGGFHFMGQDPYRWTTGDKMVPLYPGNAVVVPGSGHFFADLERRRPLLNAVASGEPANFSTGFSSRPQEHVAAQTANGHGAFNGWGAHCYNGKDPSFSAWTCAAGTRCLQLHNSAVAPGMGVCVSQSGQEIGDPTESGDVTISKNRTDKYTLTKKYAIPPGNDYVNSPQSAQPGAKTGGFPGGSIRLSTCETTPMNRHPEASCGALPAASNGFNDCLFKPNVSFKECLDIYSKGVGLRGCSRENPCRDDYICVETLEFGKEDAGVCVPPYFLFQFRVDGHPVKFK